MSIGQQTFTSTKYHTGASTAKVTLNWGDENQQIFTGTGVKTIELPSVHTANSYGEVWIVNAQTAANSLTVDHDATGRGTTTDADVTIGQNKAALFKYIPQRTETTGFGPDAKSVPAGSWMPILSA